MNAERENNRTQREKRFWDITAFRYDKFIWSKTAESYRKVLGKIVSEVKPDDIVLDVATGTGIIAFEVAKIAKKVYGIDISPKMLKKAEEKLKSGSIKNIEFKLEDGYKTSFNNNMFDAVICCNALHMMKDPRLVLKEMRRVLKDNGILIAPTFCHKESKTLKTKISLNFFKFLRWVSILPYLCRFRREDILIICNC